MAHRQLEHTVIVEEATELFSPRNRRESFQATSTRALGTSASSSHLATSEPPSASPPTYRVHQRRSSDVDSSAAATAILYQQKRRPAPLLVAGNEVASSRDDAAGINNATSVPATTMAAQPAIQTGPPPPPPKGPADQLFRVVGVIPASRGATQTAPTRVVVYVARRDQAGRSRFTTTASSTPSSNLATAATETPHQSSAKEVVDSTQQVTVKFFNNETEKVVRGNFKGRCRQNEIYGSNTSRELLASASNAPADKSGFVAFNTLCKAQKMQALYLADELQEAGLFRGALIQKIAFRVSDNPDRSLENLRIAYAWSHDETLTEFQETSVVYGPVTLSQSAFVSTQWLTFPLSEPIEWDGQSNLIVELSKDESHASFSWPASGGVYFKTTSNVRSVGQKDNNDSSGTYPFTTWKNPSRFRKVPALAVQVSSPACFKVLCSVPLKAFGFSVVNVSVAMDTVTYARETASFIHREADPLATGNLTRDLGLLLENQPSQYTDVDFVFGGDGDTRFHAHQVILAARSPVFFEMFTRSSSSSSSSSIPSTASSSNFVPKQRRSSQEETDVNENSVVATGHAKEKCIVCVPDIRPAVFSLMLKFFYTASVELHIDTACELFKCADEYQVEDLKKSCEEFLKQSASIETVTSLLLSAEKWKVLGVRSFCLDFLLWHFDAVSRTEAFARLLVPKHELIREILMSRRTFLERHINAKSKEKSSQFSSAGTANSNASVVNVMSVSFVAALIKDLEGLLLARQGEDRESFTDVVFVVGEEHAAARSFAAHKVILSSRCEVFAAMFRSEMREQQEDVVKIPNIRPKVFSCVLQYLYTGKADIQLDYVFELYRAADQFVLQELKFSCEEYAVQEITIDNVAQFLVEADRWQVSSVRSFCVDLAVSEFDEVSITPGFLTYIVPRHDLFLEILLSRNPETTD